MSIRYMYYFMKSEKFKQLCSSLKIILNIANSQLLGHLNARIAVTSNFTGVENL